MPVSIAPSHALASVRGSAIRDLLTLIEQPQVLSMAGGLPATELIPRDRIAEATQRSLRDPRALQYTASAGVHDCRVAVAAHIGSQPDRVLVTHGSQQALFLVAHALVDQDAVVVVDDPVYVGALQVFQSVRADIRALPSTPDGLDTDELERWLAAGLRPRIIHTVSNFHNPRGVTMSQRRREHLARLAGRYGFWIVDDDPYGQLRYVGEPMKPLAALSDRVITLGSASKLLAPALRVGWLSAPSSVIVLIERLRQAADLCGSTLSQLIVADLLADEGWLETHIAVLRSEYGARAAALTNALTEQFGPRAAFATPQGGMFCWVQIPGVDAAARLQPAIQAGVGYVPGAAFGVNEGFDDCLRLSFATLAPDLLGEAVRRLGLALGNTAPA